MEFRWSDKPEEVASSLEELAAISGRSLGSGAQVEINTP
jgi:hypothetical protein